MEILPGIEIIDLSLWLKKEKILIISDLHLGYEGMLENKGLLMPRFQLNDILDKLKKILKKIKPQKIIINGDLKHEFGKILNQEWRDILRLFDFLLKSCLEIIIIKGNHDLFLGPIIQKRNIKIVKEYQIKDLLICHGDELIKTQAKTIILGHEHPAILLKHKTKSEKYKCFLKGKFKGKNLIIMPSFNPLLEGANILKNNLLSPYLKNISNLEVYAVGEKTYLFGKVKDLIKSL